MSFDAIVCAGHPAWEPSRGVTDVEAFHVETIPLVGTFVVSGETVFFACISGYTSPSSVWAYACLSDAEANLLDGSTFDDVTALQNYVLDLFKERKAVLAIAMDGLIKRWTATEISERGVLDAVISFLDTEMLTDPVRRERATQARVDATVRELQPV